MSPLLFFLLSLVSVLKKKIQFVDLIKNKLSILKPAHPLLFAPAGPEGGHEAAVEVAARHRAWGVPLSFVLRVFYSFHSLSHI